IAGGKSPADPDTTSLVILQLQPLSASDATVASALAKAKTWLLARQHADGSFNGGTSTNTPNANSTGLAGWALGELGDTSAAAKAAQWVRNHQVQPLSGCATKVDKQKGAIAYDTAALTAGRKSGITTDTRDQWRRAASQSVPVLKWLPAQARPTLSAPAGYLRAGSTTTVAAKHGVAGSTVCIAVASTKVLRVVASGGTAQARVTLPAGTAHRTVRLTDGTVTRTATVKVLGKKVLTVKVPAKAKRGATVTVRISGLAPNEKLTVRRGSTIVKHASANAHGKRWVTVSVGKKVQRVKISVQGQFPKIRKGADTVKVTKR
ncbi:MAG TPA: hypothetical protein VF426_04475, partial [Marmoricola sp.]